MIVNSSIVSLQIPSRLYYRHVHAVSVLSVQCVHGVHDNCQQKSFSVISSETCVSVKRFSFIRPKTLRLFSFLFLRLNDGKYGESRFGNDESKSI